MSKQTYIKEKSLDNVGDGIPYEILKILGQKLETHICKIECKEGHGTGFFCNIPYKWNILKALITNEHVLNKDDIMPGKIIKFSINNEKYYFELKFDELRKTYISEKYDITIIELKKEDELDKISFFDIDNQIFEENTKDIFKNKQIFLLHYPKGEGMVCSNGIIKNINEDNYTIQHLCNSNSGSSGGPLINAKNFQVIGIHKGGGFGTKNYNMGTFLKEPIEIYKEQINENIKDKNYNNIKNEYLKEIVD